MDNIMSWFSMTEFHALPPVTAFPDHVTTSTGIFALYSLQCAGEGWIEFMLITRIKETPAHAWVMRTVTSPTKE